MSGTPLMLFIATFLALTSVSRGAPPEAPTVPVEYDEALGGRFFDIDEWSPPWSIVEHEDGSFEDVTGVITKREEIPRLRHTAACRTDHRLPHVIRFAEARRVGGDAIEIRIHDETASTNDDLRITVSGGRFSASYRTVYPVARENDGLVCATTKQLLWLDKRTYRTGDVVRGRIEFECVETREPKRAGGGGIRTTIRIEGPFKPVLR